MTNVYILSRYVPAESGCCGRPSITSAVAIYSSREDAELEKETRNSKNPSTKIWFGSEDDDWELVKCSYEVTEVPFITKEE